MRSLPGKKVSGTGDKPDLALILDHYAVKYSHSDRQKVLCPVHDDSSPSCSVNLSKGLWNCLSGDTLVQTREGVFPIADLAAGGDHELLTTKGWVVAPIRSYGEQELMTLTLSRNGRERVIRATPDHRWITSSGQEVTTENLRTYHRLSSVSPPRSGNIKPSHLGVMHGFTFGDGHLEATTGVANFIGAKDAALRPWFHQGLRSLDVGGEQIRTYGMPRYFKDLPPINEYPNYLHGWLAGYFAADGYVSPEGWPVISSASLSNLEFVKHVALTRLGIVSHDIRGHERRGIDGKWSLLYQLSFARKSLASQFFLTNSHRERFEAGQEVRERLGYSVRSVERTGEREEVFCATVCGVGNFALDGNLLTGNCHACQKGGDAITLVMEKEGISDFSTALRRCSEITGTSFEALRGQPGESSGVARVARGKGIKPQLGGKGVSSRRRRPFAG